MTRKRLNQSVQLAAMSLALGYGMLGMPSEPVERQFERETTPETLEKMRLSRQAWDEDRRIKNEQRRAKREASRKH